MARSVTVTKTLIAANAALFAASQTPVSGTPLTLTGAVTDTQRRVLLTYGVEGSARTLTLTGTNDAGATISEILQVPSGAGGTVASNFDYHSITSALPLGGGWTAAVTLGTNTVGSTPWFVPNAMITPFQIAIALELLSGAANFQCDVTYDEVELPISFGNLGGLQLPIPNPIPTIPTGLGPVSANTYGGIGPNPVHAFRLTINSGTGLVQLGGQQAGIRN